MSEAKPKRKFWQFHLSTALLMMTSASGFIWMNCIGAFVPPPGYEERTYSEYAYGWPEDIVYLEIEFHGQREIRTWVYWTGILKNIAVLVLGLGVLAFCSESLIRRREVRKT